MELVPTKRLQLFAGRGNRELSDEIAAALDVPLGEVVPNFNTRPGATARVAEARRRRGSRPVAPLPGGWKKAATRAKVADDHRCSPGDKDR